MNLQNLSKKNKIRITNLTLMALGLFYILWFPIKLIYTICLGIGFGIWDAILEVITDTKDCWWHLFNNAKWIKKNLKEKE
jgi:hypothetical protein